MRSPNGYLKKSLSQNRLIPPVKTSKNAPKTSQKRQNRFRAVFGPFWVRFGAFSDRFARFSHRFFRFFGVDVVAGSFSSIVVVVAVVVVAVDVVDAVVVDIVVVGRRR